MATFGLANAFDGPTLVAAWSAMAAALAYMATRVDNTPVPALSDAERLLYGACGFLALAITHMLVVEAPPVAIAEGVDDLGCRSGGDRLLRGRSARLLVLGSRDRADAGDGGGLRRRHRVRLPRLGG